MNNVHFNTEPMDGALPSDSDGAKAKLICPMPIQKETPNGLVDTICNGDIAEHQAGLCRQVLHCLELGEVKCSLPFVHNYDLISLNLYVLILLAICHVLDDNQ